MTVWFSADLHLGHDKDFIYEPRGFHSVQENAENILENFHNVLQKGDSLYLLGDVLVGPNSNYYLKYLRKLPVNLHLVWGNHDTDRRKILLQTLPNTIEVIGYSGIIKFGKKKFYLCHYPTITSNVTDEKRPWDRLICLYGHTHQKQNFYNDNPFIYHVGVDSHNCFPVSLDEIINDISNKILSSAF